VIREISEKTLELNVCAELLREIRRAFPKAIWLGLTQSQERKVGLDELIRNAGRGRHFMLQFKSPVPTSLEDAHYRFSINTEQHLTLMAGVASWFPDAVWYVLPLFSTWNKVDDEAPSLVNDTWAVRAADVDSSTWWTHPLRHRLDARTRSRKTRPRIDIHSPQENLPSVRATELFPEQDAAREAMQRWIPSGTLLDWMLTPGSGIDRGLQGVVSPSAMRWRGLSSFFVPEG
jgi:hypothetical protein